MVLFERGQWVDEEYEVFNPPAGTPSSVQLSDVACESCGYRFDIGQHYSWPIIDC